MDDFLPKPVDPAHHYRLLTRRLDRTDPASVS